MKPVYIRSVLVFTILLVNGVAGAQVKNNNQDNEEFKMSVVERNKEVVRNLYEQILNKRNFESLREIISDDFKGPDGNRGATAFEDRVAVLIEALPDIQWNIQELFGEGDKVMVRWRVEGTHTGPFMTISPTGKRVSNEGLGIYKLKDGKVINARVHTDRLGFLQELGVISPDLIRSLAANTQSDRVIFMDKFLVSSDVKEEFVARMNGNRDFIKELPGFVKDNVYEETAGNGTLVYITVAVWENEEALNQAKEAVQKEYERIEFNPAEFMEKLNIKVERGTYRELKE